MLPNTLFWSFLGHFSPIRDLTKAKRDSIIESGRVLWLFSYAHTLYFWMMWMEQYIDAVQKLDFSRMGP